MARAKSRLVHPFLVVFLQRHIAADPQWTPDSLAWRWHELYGEPNLADEAKDKRDKAPDTRSAKALRAFHEEDDLEKEYDLRLLSKLWPFARPDKRVLTLSMTALVTLALLSLVRPLLFRSPYGEGDKLRGGPQ